jgi:hypothetical protein
MKASHLRTPRSLSECSFFPSADPIERFRRDNRAAEWVVGALLIGGVAVVLIAAAIAAK